MEQRILGGSLALLIVVAIATLDTVISHYCTWEGALGTLLRHGSLIPVGAAIVVGMAAHELAQLMRAVQIQPLRGWAVISSVALVLVPWLAIATPWPGVVNSSTPLIGTLVVFVSGLLGSASWFVLRAKIHHGTADILGTWGVICYAGLLPAFGVLIRCAPYVPGEVGASAFLYFLVVAKASDIGAYFTGSLFGRTKLAPEVSPGKTVEGALGAVVFTILASLLLNEGTAWLSWHFSDSGAAKTDAFQLLSAWQAVIFGAVISVFSQMGDLLESLFKRDARMKDSARRIPTFGGILDIVDSAFFCAPAGWYLLGCLWDVI